MSQACGGFDQTRQGKDQLADAGNMAKALHLGMDQMAGSLRKELLSAGPFDFFEDDGQDDVAGTARGFNHGLVFLRVLHRIVKDDIHQDRPCPGLFQHVEHLGMDAAVPWPAAEPEFAGGPFVVIEGYNGAGHGFRSAARRGDRFKDAGQWALCEPDINGLELDRLQQSRPERFDENGDDQRDNPAADERRNMRPVPCLFLEQHEPSERAERPGCLISRLIHRLQRVWTGAERVEGMRLLS